MQGMYANYGGSFQSQILRPDARLTFLTLGLCLYVGAGGGGEEDHQPIRCVNCGQFIRGQNVLEPQSILWHKVDETMS